MTRADRFIWRSGEAQVTGTADGKVRIPVPKEPTMAYVRPNFKTKKALREALANGEEVMAFNPGLGDPPLGECCVEGPHFPAPHTWYATVKVDMLGRVTQVLS